MYSLATASRVLSSAILFVLLTSASVSMATLARDSVPGQLDPGDPPGVERGEAELLISHGSSRTGAAKAPTDSVYIYGGPGTTEGKFQTASGAADKGGWVGLDATDFPVFWEISEFNAATLAGSGAGNQAAWCGQSAAQQPGWLAAPGYGNGWTSNLIFERAVADPSVGQTVALDFFFHHDSELNFDFFRVQYDSAGTWTEVYAIDGTNRDTSGNFPAPGIQFSTQPGVSPIVYAGNDYSTDGTIRLRLRFTSDGAWSDQDGLYDGDGAAQVDDITVTCSEGTFFEDFEAGFTHWRPDKPPFVGDFFGVYPYFTDLDPCVRQATPVAGFLDLGQDVNNSASAALIPGYPTSTGGQVSNTWSYGVPGDWVVNYQGGLAGEDGALANYMVSPEIDWNLPGPEDDGVDYVGLVFRFDVWRHLSYLDGFYTTWSVRSSVDGVQWSGWQGININYGFGHPEWRRAEYFVSQFVQLGATKVQVRLGVRDLADAFGLPGNDATPSPVYDNVSLQKFRVGGPGLHTRTIDLAQDGFPISGTIDASSLAARDALDIPFDMARDVNMGGSANVPGDSIYVDEVLSIAGTTVTDRRMVWVLDKNPLFEDAIRSAPARSKDENVDSSDPFRWTGEVVGQQSTTSSGASVAGRFFYDLPDVDFLYPGDVLRYYIQATDSDGRVTTLPDDTSGFLSGWGYDRTYRVYGLPSLMMAPGAQSTKLIVNDFGRRGGENEFEFTGSELGFSEGIDYDIYTVQGPTSGVGNGIGSAGAHGANAAQLAGYDTIVYLSGNLSSFTLSDGSDQASNDKSDDLGVLTAWHALPGARNMVYFGDNIGSALESAGAAGAAYVQDVMSVDVIDVDVADAIDGQTAPVVLPVDNVFAQSWVAYGGCPQINQFDHIVPLAPAFRGHGFELVGAAGATYENIAASVVHDRLVDGDRKVDITFPFGFLYVYNVAAPDGSITSARTEVLREAFDYFGVPSSGAGTPVVPSALAPRLSVYPSPFNPRTVVSLSVPSPGDGRVEVFDLRGRRIRVLHAGPLTSAAEHSWLWEGTDDAGVSVASGVYVIRAKGKDFNLTQRAVLLK